MVTVSKPWLICGYHGLNSNLDFFYFFLGGGVICCKNMVNFDWLDCPFMLCTVFAVGLHLRKLCSWTRCFQICTVVWSCLFVTDVLWRPQTTLLEFPFQWPLSLSLSEDVPRLIGNTCLYIHFCNTVIMYLAARFAAVSKWNVQRVALKHTFNTWPWPFFITLVQARIAVFSLCCLRYVLRPFIIQISGECR